MDVRICFRITIPGENGEPEQHGMCLELNHVREGITAEQLGACINKQRLIDAACLTGIVTPDQMEMISPEEFDKVFSEDDLVDVDA